MTKRYGLYRELEYEPYFVIWGTLDEIVQEIKSYLRCYPHLTDDDFSIYEQADVSVLELIEKARGEIE